MHVPNIHFHEIRAVGAALIHADRRTDMAKVTSGLETIRSPQKKEFQTDAFHEMKLEY
jgi:hypothetical protein